jgi:hypothetical protein
MVRGSHKYVFNSPKYVFVPPTPSMKSTNNIATYMVSGSHKYTFNSPKYVFVQPAPYMKKNSIYTRWY